MPANAEIFRMRISLHGRGIEDHRSGFLGRRSSRTQVCRIDYLTVTAPADAMGMGGERTPIGPSTIVAK
jgi:hypothetical protein